MECLVDEPSANYEMMYDYSGDIMLQVGRWKQLLVLEQLCFNFCTFS